MKSTVIHGFFKFAVNSHSVGRNTHTLEASALLSISALCAEGMWFSSIFAREKWNLKGRTLFPFYHFLLMLMTLLWCKWQGEGWMHAALFPLLTNIYIHCVPVNCLILHESHHPPHLQERAVKDGFAEGMTLLGRPLKEKWKTSRSAGSFSQSLLLLPWENVSNGRNSKRFKRLNFSF